jgi:hypothetical protein
MAVTLLIFAEKCLLAMRHYARISASRDGEIGRRSGLKIRRGQKPCGGSIPPPGTIQPIHSRLVSTDSSRLPCIGHRLRSGAILAISAHTRTELAFGDAWDFCFASSRPAASARSAISTMSYLKTEGALWPFFMATDSSTSTLRTLRIPRSMTRMLNKLNTEMGPRGFQAVGVVFDPPNTPDSHGELIFPAVNFFHLSYPVGYSHKVDVDRYLDRKPQEILNIPASRHY